MGNEGKARGSDIMLTSKSLLNQLNDNMCVSGGLSDHRLYNMKMRGKLCASGNHASENCTSMRAGRKKVF